MSDLQVQAETTTFEHTGPQTHAGRYIRRFWQPLYIGADLLPKTSKFVTRINQDFTLYRDLDGEVHLVDARCPHRGARLALGWIEGSALRCRYHGWKFDESGQCVDQPGEASAYASKIKIRSYPVLERYGVVWAFLGDGAPPPFPEFLSCQEEFAYFHFMMIRHCNYFQDLENLLDDVHLSFLHLLSNLREPSWGRSPPPATAVPTIRAEETQFGLLQRSSCADGKGRAVAFVMPNGVYFKTAAHRDLLGFDAMNWAIPIDDRSHVFLQTVAVPKARKEVVERFETLYDGPVKNGRDSTMRHYDDEVNALLRGHKTIDDLEDHGLETVHVEDAAMQESQGVISDRTREALGQSDRGIILLRRIWRREVAALARGAFLKPFEVPDRLASLRSAVADF